MRNLNDVPNIIFSKPTFAKDIKDKYIPLSLLLSLSLFQNNLRRQVYYLLFFFYGKVDVMGGSLYLYSTFNKNKKSPKLKVRDRSNNQSRDKLKKVVFELFRDK